MDAAGAEEDVAQEAQAGDATAVFRCDPDDGSFASVRLFC